MDQIFNDVIKVIDFYCEIIENPEVFNIVDDSSLKKSFEACVFIENVMKKIHDSKKDKEFESHLKNWMLQKKKTKVYQCSDFSNACDQLLEFCFKEEKISNENVDDFLKLYIQQCGNVRLEKAIHNIMTHAMQANAIITVLKNLEFPQSDIEDELLLSSWNNEIELGRRKKVIELIVDMFHKDKIPKLISLAYKSISESPVNTLILDYFTQLLEDNNIKLYTELKNTKRKVLLKLLTDYNKFEINFIDTTFYIGRNMYEENGEWVSDSGFTYDDLEAMILVLLSGPISMANSTIERIKLAKELDAVFEGIERDCIL
uniref:Uncharacterized protein n=1 Tax=Trichogramma kaykai TaxID=54128 RepID=A0ABD2W8X6_9HYME